MSNLKSKWVSLIALLGFVSIESTAEGSYFQNEDIDKIDAELAQNKESINSLITEKDALQNKIDQLTTDLSNAQQSLADATTTNTTLQSEVDRLNEVVSRQPKNNQSLNKTGAEGTESNFAIDSSAGWADAQKDLKTRI